MSKKKPNDKVKMSSKDAIAAIKAAAEAQAQKNGPGITPAVTQVPGEPFDFKKCHLHIGIPCYGV